MAREIQSAIKSTDGSDANRDGFALEATLLVMVLISVLILAAASGVVTTMRTTTMDRANTEALYVAEGGADAVMAQLSSYMSDGFLSDAEVGAVIPPTILGWSFEPVIATKVGGQQIATITDGSFAGLVSYNQQIDLRVKAYDARNNRGDVIISANAQAIPVFQFGVFYDNDLEIHPGANMTFEGWVHTNGNLFLSSNSLNFQSLLTTPDSVIWNRKSNNDRLNGVEIDDAGGTPVQLDFDQRSTTYAQFVANSQTDFDGRLRSIAHNVAPLRLPLPMGVPPRTMIEPRDVADNMQVRGVKFAWKADFLLRINLATQTVRHDQANHFCNDGGAVGTAPTNGSGDLTATWQRDSGFSALPTSAECKGIFKWNPTTANAAAPVLTPTRFRDGREDVLVRSLDIDVAALRAWANAGWATRRSRVIYVEFYNNPGNIYPAVRLINAARLPGSEPTPAPTSDYGITVATHAPIYVKGNFNYLAGNLNYWKPAALAGDAIIFQSPAWSDVLNGGNYGVNAASYRVSGGFTAANTMYVYAAVAAGHSPTTCDWQAPGCAGSYPDDYGGGLENFPRFLENWNGTTLLYRGSLVSLFFAQQAAVRTWAATPTYYSPPTRDWRFDMRFQDPANLPPGTPLVGTVMQLAYRPVY